MRTRLKHDVPLLHAHSSAHDLLVSTLLGLQSASITLVHAASGHSSDSAQIFEAAIQAGNQRKLHPDGQDFCSQVLDLVHELDTTA